MKSRLEVYLATKSMISPQYDQSKDGYKYTHTLSLSLKSMILIMAGKSTTDGEL